jgi:RHS repeat-associated protein
MEFKSRQYVYGLGLVSQVSGANTYYYLSDGLGSTMAMVDGSGTVVKTYGYDVYGKVTSSSGSAPNEFDFAGQQTDQTGLQYLRARYYDSEAGIFLSRDPMTRIAGWAGNPFGYVSANPVNLVDPRGLWPFTACSIACWKPATETNPLFAIEELFLGGTATNLYRVCSFVFVGEYKDCGTSTYTGQYLLDHWDDIMKPATAIASTIINGIDVLKLGRRGK